jgi:putative hydrolase of the HAD superfamily
LAIRGVVFDIGGVLEHTPRTGWDARWEARLGLPAGDLNTRLRDVWRAGSIGAITEAEVEARIRAILGLDAAQGAAFMADLWDEYCGTLNAELAAYFAGLRPRYQTAILSNSFAGAREHEHARYGFGDLCDLIIYSHEVGLAKPDPRIYALTAARLGLAPAEIVFPDDVEAAVAAARACGWHAVQFHDTAQAIAEIQAHLASAEG